MLFPTGGIFRVGICLGCYGIYIYIYIYMYIYIYIYIPNFWDGGEVGKRGKGVYDTWHMKWVYSQLLGRAKYEGVYSGDSMSQFVQGTWRVDW